MAQEPAGLDDEAAGAKELFRAAVQGKELLEPENVSEDEEGQMPRGSVWRFFGEPLRVSRGAAAREVHDGANLCSPGRLPIREKEIATESSAKLACWRGAHSVSRYWNSGRDSTKSLKAKGNGRGNQPKSVLRPSGSGCWRSCSG